MREKMVEERVVIPRERIKLLKQKASEFEKVTGVSLRFSNEEVVISGDPLQVYRTHQVVLAFGRGFDLETATRLLNENFTLHIIDMREWGKSRSRIETLKGRVIGRRGRAKRIIEEYTGAKLAIYGKTISIIGEWTSVSIARQAVEMLLAGRPHGAVYRFLETQK